MKITATIVLLCSILGGCCSPQYVERSETDTLYIPIPDQHGDFWGGVFADNDSISISSPDSVLHVESKKDSTGWRTKYTVKHDSIPYPVEVTKWLPQEKESYPFLSKLGLVLIGLSVGAGLGLFLGKKSLISIGGK